MPYSVKTNWSMDDIVLPDDFNRIEGNIQHLQDTKETPAGAQAKVDAHESKTSTHGATSAATANRIIIRDSAGRAKVAAPSAPDDIARKAEVDTVQANLTSHMNNKNNPHNVTPGQIGAETPAGAQAKADAAEANAK
ncbi:MAG TPA: hypothetical protein PLU88_02970, partial [Armatimonadota bacterium]|nr:hypothetical protein [Armatimonadota bacterium]